MAAPVAKTTFIGADLLQRELIAGFDHKIKKAISKESF
jgi:hypothetical protein